MNLDNIQDLIEQNIFQQGTYQLQEFNPSYFYCPTGVDNLDIWLRKDLDEKLEELFNDIHHYFISPYNNVDSEKSKFNNEYALQIPGKDVRLEMLKKYHKKYLDQLQSSINSYQILYLNERSLINNIKFHFKNKLCFLIEKIEKETIYWNTDFYHLIDSTESDDADIIQHLVLLDLIKNIEWVNDLIKIETNFIEETKIINANIKLKWTGSPGEFGAIINRLYDYGYLEKIGDLKNNVRQLNKIFDIRNEDGKTVTDEYLYKCFSEKEKKFNPDQFKIIHSTNFNK